MGKLHPFPVCILRRQPVNKTLEPCVFTINRLDYKYQNNLCQAYPAKECLIMPTATFFIRRAKLQPCDCLHT